MYSLRWVASAVMVVGKMMNQNSVTECSSVTAVDSRDLLYIMMIVSWTKREPYECASVNYRW